MGISLLDPLKALRNPVLLRTSIGAALYTAAFFTVLAAVLCVVAAGLLTLNWTDTRDVPSEAVLAGEQLVG
ncbi:hypothetical protein [Lentzea albidocapillata]|uniref:Uncharacterized protein n=1 Tax=Lentzea albidocapillata TaxID=40571 RepID=A0A1W2EHA6_9PSEU|nr:hypothetical protein [Lentzea albidocapillata]SMD09087.1 hypothetical protein SAMN05660733_04084 [Lentzea albidocapillata]